MPRLLPLFAWSITALCLGQARADSRKAAEHAREAEVAFRAGDYDKALEAISLAIQHDPKHGDYLRKRGSLCLGLKMYARAHDDFSALIKLEPNDPGAYFYRGACHEHPSPRFVTEAAIADFTKCIELRPRAEAYRRRGDEYLLGLRDHARALADYNAALKLDPKSFSSYMSRGLVFDRMKEHLKAVADFTRALELSPKMPMLYCFRGDAYRKAGKLKDALSDLNRAIELDEHYGFAYRQRGETYAALGDNLKAAADRARAEKEPLGPGGKP